MGCSCSKLRAHKEPITLKSTNALYSGAGQHNRNASATAPAPTIQEMAAAYQDMHECVNTAAVKDWLAAYSARGLFLLMAADAPMYVTRGAYNTLWDAYHTGTEQFTWPLKNPLSFFSSYIKHKCAVGAPPDITSIANLRVGDKHFTYLRSSANGGATHDFTYSDKIKIIRVKAATGDYELFE